MCQMEHRLEVNSENEWKSWEDKSFPLFTNNDRVGQMIC